jgi:hypothetical protein
MFSVSCSKVKTTASGPQRAATDDGKNDDAQSQRLPQKETTPEEISYNEMALSFPTWCEASKSLVTGQEDVKPSESEACIRCTRADDDVNLVFEECFQALPDFEASSSCWLTGETMKRINCEKTATGEPFAMDVSTAKEKVSESLPALLIALNLQVAKKYPADSVPAKLTRDLSAFIGSRVGQVMRRENHGAVASDLTMLLNKYTSAPLSEAQANLFKAAVVAALDGMVQELSGKKNYDLAGTIVKIAKLKDNLPKDLIGKAQDLISGHGLADLLADNNTKVLDDFLKLLGPSVNYQSAEEFLAKLRQGP